MSDDIKKVLKKYENNWLSLIEKSSSGMTTKELMEYTIARNLTTKSLSDIEKYLTDYPIFHDTVDLGMSGSLHFWSVELDRAHILALSKQLTADLAGTGMTDADATALAKNLESLSFSGKMGLDPTNAKVSSLDGVFSASGKVISSISLIKNENNGSIRISSPKSDSEMILNYGKKDNRYSFDGALSQS